MSTQNLGSMVYLDFNYEIVTDMAGKDCLPFLRFSILNNSLLILEYLIPDPFDTESFWPGIESLTRIPLYFDIVIHKLTLSHDLKARNGLPARAPYACLNTQEGLRRIQDTF